MPSARGFKDEHGTIANAIATAEGLIRKKLDSPGTAEEMARLLSTMLAAASTHFKRERDLMYPKLRAINPDLVAGFEKRITEIASAFQALVTKYRLPSAIKANADACARELTGAFDLVKKLVKDEEAQLYPAFEKLP